MKNNISADARQVIVSQGSAFATIGGSLTISDSELSRDTRTGKDEFYHPGASVVLKRPNLAGRKLSGTYTLGENGFTPES